MPPDVPDMPLPDVPPDMPPFDMPVVPDMPSEAVPARMASLRRSCARLESGRSIATPVDEVAGTLTPRPSALGCGAFWLDCANAVPDIMAAKAVARMIFFI